ncbi:DUF6118 family protein [Ochrobactrum sp. WV_118_8]|uniref:DUF6118 family protein n=1 Tax=Brucella anthropi TaxID=529 RepID=UPI00188B99C1|nr:DUF6118 family protein [Brucella anthropi]QPA29848.1 hypothetical protein IR196_22820 [Brucella anthropi]
MTERDDEQETALAVLDEDEAGDPAAAFDALRRTIEAQGAQIAAELTVMRRGLEAAFDQFDRIGVPQDYKPQLARIVQALDTVADRLQDVEQLPVLKQDAQHYAAIIGRSGENLVHGAVRQIERQASDLERVGRNLTERIESARERRRQDWWLSGMAGGGVIIGVLLTLFAPRILPGTIDMAVASTVMNDDRWNAGAALMQSESPAGWRNIVDADHLVQANRETLTACASAAAKAGKDQKCTITVSAPTR